MKTSTLLYLITGLSLAVLPACGEPDDPSKNKDDNNKTTAMVDMGTTPTDSGNTTPDSGNTTPDSGSTTPDSGNTTPDSGNTTPDSGNTTPDMLGGGGEECEVRAMYEGQMGSTRGGGGGVFALGTGAYEADSGMEAVLAAVDQAIAAGEIKPDDEETDEREDEKLLADGSELVVTGAIITSTSYERSSDNGDYLYPRSITFQDQKVATNIFLPASSEFIANLQTDKDGNPLVLKVGDKVNFKVKLLKARAGVTPQIGGITEIEKVGAGEDVGVDERTGKPISGDDVYKMVRVHGNITADNGTCGGDSVCFDLTHGSETHVFRISSKVFNIPAVGDCITFVGPLSEFSGNAQLDAINFVWYRGPFAE